MTRRTVLRLLFVSLGVVGGPVTTDAEQVPRLIADNKTSYYADVYSWNGQWSFVIRLNPFSWTQFPNANPGSAWRAVIGSTVRDHIVNYVWDAGYGGYQDVWWIQ
jgi:hypothetical protein